MVKKKINVAVFISGRGTNLKSIINLSKNKNSKYIVKLVICNNKYAEGLKSAKVNKINSIIGGISILGLFFNPIKATNRICKAIIYLGSGPNFI